MAVRVTRAELQGQRVKQAVTGRPRAASLLRYWPGHYLRVFLPCGLGNTDVYRNADEMQINLCDSTQINGGKLMNE